MISPEEESATERHFSRTWVYVRIWACVPAFIKRLSSARLLQGQDLIAVSVPTCIGGRRSIIIEHVHPVEDVLWTGLGGLSDLKI